MFQTKHQRLSKLEDKATQEGKDCWVYAENGMDLSEQSCDSGTMNWKEEQYGNLRWIRKYMPSSMDPSNYHSLQVPTLQSASEIPGNLISRLETSGKELAIINNILIDETLDLEK